jgi:nucleoid-associated protein Lsr2
MAKKIHVHLIDDLDASEASETLRFKVDGKSYEIDLSRSHAQEFRAEIGPYIEQARQVASGGRRGQRAGTGPGRPRGRAAVTSRSHVTPDGGPPAETTDAEMSRASHDDASPPGLDFAQEAPSAQPPGLDFADE